MAKFIDMGLIPIQDPEFGISHSNIAKKLTRNNWRNKAVMRDGFYLWIVRGKYHLNNKKVHRYYIQSQDKTGLREKEYTYLRDAIHVVNSYAEEEGDFPAEHEPGWTISFIK